MATKPQAKVAIDNASAQVKADIDNILPTGINIADGNIQFGPIRYLLLLDANGSISTAVSWFTSITANLDAVSRTYTIDGDRGRRKRDTPAPGHDILIEGTNGNPLTVRILNF